MFDSLMNRYPLNSLEHGVFCASCGAGTVMVTTSWVECVNPYCEKFDGTVRIEGKLYYG